MTFPRGIPRPAMALQFAATAIAITQRGYLFLYLISDQHASISVPHFLYFGFCENVSGTHMQILARLISQIFHMRSVPETSHAKLKDLCYTVRTQHSCMSIANAPANNRNVSGIILYIWWLKRSLLIYQVCVFRGTPCNCLTFSFDNG